MKRLYKSIGWKTILFCFLILPAYPIQAQTNALIGREFYFAAWPNLGNVNDQITLVIYPYGNGTVTIAGANYTVTEGVRLTQVVSLAPYVAANSLKITSTVDIIVCAGILGEFIGYGSADATAILPTSSLGMEYRTFNYFMNNQGSGTGVGYQAIRVIATEPLTEVYVNNIHVATLAAPGDVYVSSTNYAVDMTGTKVVANKPVAVFSGVTSSNYLGGADDILIEQMRPLETWGREYILCPTVNQSTGSLQSNCRIISNETVPVNVNVKIGDNASQIVVIPVNGYYEFQFNALTQITSSTPVAVAQYIVGNGDPSLLWVNSMEQRIPQAHLSRLRDLWTTWLTILVKSDDYNNTVLEVNGVLCNFDMKVSPAGIPGWAAGRYMLKSGENSVDVSNPSGLVAILEGFGNNRSYLYSAAGAVLNLQCYYTIASKTLPVNDTHYSVTTDATHTFEPADNIVVKRTLEKPFTAVSWLLNGITYPIAENANTMNTLNFPASALSPGENFLTMSVRFQGATADSLYTGSVWLAVAVDDTLQILACQPTAVLDVFANDTTVPCLRSAISLTITNGSKTGALTSVDANKNIVYAPASGFAGHDTLEYAVACNDILYRAKAYITVIQCPDNIIDPDCYDDPAGFAWTIKEETLIDGVYDSSPFIVGDLNGDGKPDIIAASHQVPLNSSTAQPPDSIFVFWGPDFTTKTSIQDTGHKFLAVGKIKMSDGTYKSLIFSNTATTGMLRAYDYTTPGAPLWSASVAVGGPVGLADFNNDGYTEVFVGNRIYDAATGQLLCNGGANNSGASMSITTVTGMPQAVDIIGDSRLELVAGNQIYDVQINRSAMTGTMTVVRQATPPTGCPNDGLTVVADFNNDGKLEVLVRKKQADTQGTNLPVYMYLWSPHTTPSPAVLAQTTEQGVYFGIPFVGDINGDGQIEIVSLISPTGSVTTQNGFCARVYNESANNFTLLWNIQHTDQSGGTAMTLFDFNQDGAKEIVYRDENRLRIFNGTTNPPTVLNSFIAYSETGNEYPVIVDLYGDGHARILTTSDHRATRPFAKNAYIKMYSAAGTDTWAPARKVWNQYSYNAVNVNEDLTIPPFQMSPATVFPGEDGLYGTPDDVQPFNAFLQQQTLLDANGDPFFLLPDVLTTPAIVSSEVFGDSVSIKVGLINRGDAAIGSPVYVSLYRETTSPQTFISPFFTDSAHLVIMPGDTGFVFVRLPDVTLFQPLGNIVIRLNDDGTSFPYQAECDTLNNMLTIVNPAYHQLVKKSATLFLLPSTDFFPHNGAYSNPVATLFGEEIEYRLSAVNAFTTAQTITIRDTLPAYLEYVPGSSGEPLATDPPPTPGTPPREALHWLVANVSPADSAVITFRARPQAGVSASQPMFINQAWVEVNGVNVSTNSTYHQGAGVSLVTFSAGFGGRIYNAAGQALDYGASPRSGVVVVPEEGYRFAGWRHPAYRSLRGETIEAQSGLMQYETLTVYGDVTLFADFEPQTTPVVYQIDGMDNTGHHPSVDETATDRIWAAAGELYVRTSKPGSIVRIYSVEGILLKQQIILQAHRNDDNPGVIESSRRSSAGEGNETIIKLPQGLYIVTLNNSFGTKIIITK